jgi:hypothetical protein
VVVVVGIFSSLWDAMTPPVDEDRVTPTAIRAAQGAKKPLESTRCKCRHHERENLAILSGFYFEIFKL